MAVKAYTATLTGANTDLTGVNTANVATLITGANQGTIIDEITINAVETTTAGYVRMWIDNGTGIKRLHTQIPVSAVTAPPTGTTPSWNTVIRPLNLKLAHNQLLMFTTTTGDDFHLTASVTEL